MLVTVDKLSLGVGVGVCEGVSGNFRRVLKQIFFRSLNPTNSSKKKEEDGK